MVYTAQTPMANFSSPLPSGPNPKNFLTTLAVASAVSIGANLVDVQEGKKTVGQALLNGVAKGTAATLVLNVVARETSLQTVFSIAALVGTGYLIDSAMRKNACPQGSGTKDGQSCE